MMNIYTELKNKLKSKSAIITVIGLGYVGLPIALEFSRKGFEVNGLDTSAERIKKIKNGESYLNDISSEYIGNTLRNYKFHATTDESVLEFSDVVIVCVPTPLRKVTEPDISFIVKVSKTLNRYLHRGQIIVLESTTYPGTTREVILPVLKKNGYKLDEDFYLAFSPERIDPGNPKYDFRNIPKIIGGFSKKGTELGKLLYSCVINKVVGVSSPETAEVTKLLENTFRIVNIGLINEFAHLCHRLNIDVWEVIEAAKTKPFGFMPFYPGPGIGGHCIPADPMYLSWKARKVGFETKMIDLAAKVNRNVPKHMVERIGDILAGKKKTIKDAKIHILGVTYKKDVNDLRESPALDIMEMLLKKNTNLTYHDPYIPRLDINKASLTSKRITKTFLKNQDLVVILAGHSDLDYKMIKDNAKLIFDTRNIFEKKNISAENVIKL